MPYRRSYRRRPRRTYRRRYLRRGTRSSGTNWTGLARKAFQLAKWTASVINPEFKKIDTQYSESPTTTPGIVPISLCAQGDDFDSRTGRTILMKSIEYSGLITHNTEGTGSIYHKVYFFIDKAPNQALATAAHIFLSGNAIYGVRNLDNRKRFICLKELKFVTNDTDKTEVLFNGYLKLNCHECFDDTTSNINAVTSNVLLIVTVSTDPTYGHSHSILTRVRFIDN